MSFQTSCLCFVICKKRSVAQPITTIKSRNTCLSGSAKLLGSSACQQFRIHIEAREQQYSSMISFLQAIQATPLDDRALAIRNIDVFSIVAVKKKDQPLMSLADIGAHALFAAVRRDDRTYALNETRYLKELSPVFLCSQSGSIVPKGLKPIHSLRDLALQETTEADLMALSNKNAKFRVF